MNLEVNPMMRSHSKLDAGAEELQRIEHRERMVQGLLDMNLAKQRELQREEGKLRGDLQRLENDKYRILNVTH